MIDIDQFIIQQAQWGYRYVYKSFQDAYKYSPPSDLGAAFEYSPSKIISFDLSVLNGEGFKKVQLGSIFKTTFGITLRPFGGFVLRGYTDMMKKDYTQTSLALMAGYAGKKFKAGLEYNIQQNKDMIDGNDLSGLSVYASLGVAEKFSIFTRYDYLDSSVPDNETTSILLNPLKRSLFEIFTYIPVFLLYYNLLLLQKWARKWLLLINGILALLVFFFFLAVLRWLGRMST